MTGIKTITVSSSVDDSTKLQKIIDNNGNTPVIFNFSDSQEIEINSRIEVYSHTRWEGNDCIFRLRNNAPITQFGVQKGLIGAKALSGIEDLTFRNFTVNGNYKVQAPAKKASGDDHGDGYHNQFQFGNMSNPQYENLMNCTFENLHLGYSFGDGIRVNGGYNLTFTNITSDFGGHDDIHLSSVKKAEVSHITDHNPRANNVLRTRNCTDINVHDCDVQYGAGYDTGAPFQSECITPNRSSAHIFYHNNSIKGMKGAAFYIVASQPADDIQIYNNLIVECGQLEKAINRPGVGGATILGWTNAKFYNNTVVNCRGYGVADTTFAYASKKTGDIEVYNNIFTGMKEAYTKGTASGTAIAHLTGSQTAVTAHDNCLYNNARDCYNVTNSHGISKDPLFVGNGDYHLKENSPCRFSDHQLGCYSDADKIDDDINLMITCSDDYTDTIINTLSQKYTIYRSN